MTLWSRSHMRSRDKLKAKYLLFYKANGHQILQSDDLWWGKLTHNNPLIMWSREVTWQMENLYLPFRKLYDHQTWQVGNLWWTYDPLTIWWCVVTYQTKNVAHPLWQGLWTWNLESWWLMVRWMHPMKSHIPLTTWSHEVTWQTKNEIFLQKACGQQTLQGDDMWWGEAHNEVARLWSRDHKRSRVNL